MWVYNTELYHYGRLGMRWGHRKYQNRYGGLNNAGQIRRKKLEAEYDNLSSIGRLTKKGEKRKSEVEREYTHLTGRGMEDRKLVARPKPKTVSEMTNEELTAYNTRKQLETTYLNYQPKPQVSKGKEFAKLMGKKFILPVTLDIGKAYLTSLGSDKVTGQDMAKAASKAAEAAKKAANDSTVKALKQLTK